MGEALIEFAPVEAAIESGLIASLDADLLARYPGELVNGVDPAEFKAANGCFVLARITGQAAGCGAFRPLDAATVEIKRMYVRPDFRGRRLGRAMLAALEAEARRQGYSRAILETGRRMLEAIALYRACGYAEIEPFGPYIGSARSVCFGKAL